MLNWYCDNATLTPVTAKYQASSQVVSILFCQADVTWSKELKPETQISIAQKIANNCWIKWKFDSADSSSSSEVSLSTSTLSSLSSPPATSSSSTSSTTSWTSCHRKFIFHFFVSLNKFSFFLSLSLSTTFGSDVSLRCDRNVFLKCRIGAFVVCFRACAKTPNIHRTLVGSTYPGLRISHFTQLIFLGNQNATGYTSGWEQCCLYSY